MSELKIKLENLQCTLTGPVSDEDIRAAWIMVEEIISEVAQLEASLADADRIIAIELAERQKLEAENGRLREYVQHKPECWKNQALSDLGVGGTLASCTCGLVEALGGDK